MPPNNARVPVLVWVIAAVFVAVELAFSARYGYHRDELYFLACGKRLAWGYVDQPPFVPFVARIASTIWASPVALRVLPAFAGGATAVVAALIARRLGGHRPSMVLAALATACTPAILGADHLLSTTSFDLLVWVTLIFLIIGAVESDRIGPWLAVGIVAGLGLENKNLPLLLLLAVAIGLLVCGPRRILIRPGPWVAVLVMLVLWTPNLIWQASHGWPALEMSRALHLEHTSFSDYTTVLPAQIVYAGLLMLPLWIVGLVWLLRQPRLRYLAVAMLLVLGFVVVWTPGRPYYTLGLYPMLFAAGAVVVEERVWERSGRIAVPAGWLALPVLGALIAVPLALPMLPEASAAKLRFLHKIDYDAGETVGWPSFTKQVAAVYDTLPNADVRADPDIVFTENYGEAGAVDQYGSAFGLPAAYSGHNTYWLWGPPPASAVNIVLVGDDPVIRAAFSCTQAGAIHSPYNFNNDENGTPLFRCVGRTEPWSTFWPKLKHYD